jgi:hypothetical protein
MFDADYFRTTLPRDVEAMGGDPIVEIHMMTGQAHRVRAVIEIGTGTVSFDAYLSKGDLAHHRPRFGATGAATDPHELYRSVLSYESIVAVVLDPSERTVRTQPGF